MGITELKPRTQETTEVAPAPKETKKKVSKRKLQIHYLNN